MKRKKNDYEKEIVLKLFEQDLNDIKDILSKYKYEITINDIIDLLFMSNYNTIKNDLDSIIFNIQLKKSPFVCKKYRGSYCLFKLKEKIDADQLLFLIINSPDKFKPASIEIASPNEQLKNIQNVEFQKSEKKFISSILEEKAKRILNIFCFIKGESCGF